ncbi:phosphoribosyltransferase family protein [Butyrivibrio sp. AE3009]|uniref:phosphoribosyltransferase family protein n=1 Tax=Butyrivibrio sp. AE3009 TaxID=1280666 RepID=UPI0003B73EC7|nr:phosphoribosyltransferase family protein [Butyrivibrio sp. AE3009]
MKIDAFFMNENEIKQDCIAWAEEIAQSYKPDLIIFVAKSGFLFAESIADYFSCPMAYVIASRPDNKKKDLKKIIPVLPKISDRHFS